MWNSMDWWRSGVPLGQNRHWDGERFFAPQGLLLSPTRSHRKGPESHSWQNRFWTGARPNSKVRGVISEEKVSRGGRCGWLKPDLLMHSPIGGS